MRELTIIDIFETMNSINLSYVKKTESLLTLINDYSYRKASKFNEYNIIRENRFCIFDNFSPKYYYEKLHSKILKTLLDKNTIELRTENFLDIFLDCLEIKNVISFGKNVSVDLEHPINPKVPAEAIDILIHDENNALIIENKINNAKDQDNQLVRYMRYVHKKLEISNYYVVYLTLIPNKKPLITEYSSEFDEYKKELLEGKKLLLLSAVEDDEIKKSLVNYFLPKCEEKINSLIKNEETEALLITILYIKQYTILLNKLGGYAAMASTDRELAKTIFSKKEFITSSFDFVQFWNNRWDYLYPIIFEEMNEELSSLKQDIKEKYFYHEINENCSIFFQCKESFFIGFSSNTKPWSKKNQKTLKNILTKYIESHNTYFDGNEEEVNNESDSYTGFFLKDELSIGELKTIIKQSFEELSPIVKRTFKSVKI